MQVTSQMLSAAVIEAARARDKEAIPSPALNEDTLQEPGPEKEFIKALPPPEDEQRTFGRA
eukprot:5946003-Amphidinium_carterae.1